MIEGNPVRLSSFWRSAYNGARMFRPMDKIVIARSDTDALRLQSGIECGWDTIVNDNASRPASGLVWSIRRRR